MPNTKKNQDRLRSNKKGSDYMQDDEDVRNVSNTDQRGKISQSGNQKNDTNRWPDLDDDREERNRGGSERSER